jgi:4-hydroxybenzoate polyprenyltransferase
LNMAIDEAVPFRTEISEAARITGYIRLFRPANLVTSAADVLAGFLVVGAPAGQLLWRLLASVALYGGGIVLNDFFDRSLDAIERPERPIPSGLVPPVGAAVLGFSLLIGAVMASFRASTLTGLIALAILLCVLAYDAGLKRFAVGPVLMGSCRGLNLLLGLAAAPALVPHLWFLALLPLAYIGGITLLSRGEVLGGNRNSNAIAVGLFAGVVLATALIYAGQPSSLLAASPFLLLLAVKAGVPLWRAFRLPSAALIRSAVHAGVVSLIVLDAALAAAHAGLIRGAAILSLSVIAGELGKLFPVT